MTECTRYARVIPAAVLVVAAACGAGDSADTPSVRAPADPGGAERRIIEVRADTLWTRGSFADTVIELPLHLVADGELVVLADGARRGVAALDARDGATAWTAGRQGRGPGEFERPAVLEFLPDGRLLVADVDVGRVTILQRDGRHAGEFPLESAHVTGLCALAGGTVVAVATTEEENVRTLTLQGQTLSLHAVPWRELRDQSQLTRQFVAATTPDRRDCLIALMIGRGFASFDGNDFTYVRDYIEPMQTPDVIVRRSQTRSRRDQAERLDRARISTRAVASTATHHFVVFEGASAEAGRMIDVYDHSGAYDHSFRVPRRVHKLAWANDVFYLLTLDQGIPVITAVRLTRIP